MLDQRTGQTIIGWDLDEPGGSARVCDAEADNWVIQWVGTEPPNSVWATADDRRDDPLAAFRVWPLHLNTTDLPAGTVCAECGFTWNGRDWVAAADGGPPPPAVSAREQIKADPVGAAIASLCEWAAEVTQALAAARMAQQFADLVEGVMSDHAQSLGYQWRGQLDQSKVVRVRPGGGWWIWTGPQGDEHTVDPGGNCTTCGIRHVRGKAP
jgi:hypothetical protein